ncbi:hypothetical protein [Verrucomicrobium spinosum]|uniref:hypothetical protein n=1 Tax=Verrucomicrobium spinosum TaxID=2736 RepID=UPI0012E25F75|nr:hypothetical protein [Verrucomicrobium spinosum]
MAFSINYVFSRANTSGLRVVFETNAEAGLPLDDIRKVLSFTESLPDGAMVRYLSFETSYGHTVEVNDSDVGWESVLEAVPRVLEGTDGAFSAVGFPLPDEPAVVVYSRDA